MVTVKADDRRRVQLPNIKPGQVLAVDDHGDGSITLTVVKPHRKEPFPKGSLVKYVDEWNKEWADAAGKMPVPPLPEDF
jgi:hypothetical protein